VVTLSVAIFFVMIALSYGELINAVWLAMRETICGPTQNNKRDLLQIL
jgi:hypothetical protein